MQRWEQAAVRIRRSAGATRPARGRPASDGVTPRGGPARIEVPIPRPLNLISTISDEGSVHFMTYGGTMTAALFITFLERMLERDDERSS